MDQINRGVDDTVEDARASIHDEVDHENVQQGRCHVERENEELKARLASLLGDHEKLAIAEASLRSEHEDRCIMMAARQVDHDALHDENVRLSEQLEKASHDLEEAKANYDRSQAAIRSFLEPYYSSKTDLVSKWDRVTRLADNIQTAIDYVDQDKTIAWYKTSDLENAFSKMQRYTDLLRVETEHLSARLGTEVIRYGPYYYGSSEAKQAHYASDVELSFEQQQQKTRETICVSSRV